MAWVPIVLGIKPGYAPAMPKKYIEIIYRNGNQQMKLDNILPNKAEKAIHHNGQEWHAYEWREMDGISNWELVK